MSTGKIITFYSYKGGVGRTMSLANIATILAQWGYKVLIVDWDLEAPGLERYFMNYCSVKFDKKQGIIDLLLSKSFNKKINWSRYLLDINISNDNTLKFLGSGKKGTDYFDKLKKLDIDSLYERNSGFEFFERLRDEWKSKFDYILIDSRTGITDNGGICTIQLPDIVFVFTNTNEQSVLGTKEIIERINFSQQSQPYDRQNLIIFPILCRFDTTTEFEISQVWIKKVSDNLTNVYNDWLPLKVSLKEFIEKTKIPYFPYFSFGEKLSVIEQGYSDPSSMGYAYESIASIIGNNFENIDNFINNRSDYIIHAKKSYSQSSLIKIIGVGGGGSNAVTHMFNLGIKGVDFILCNTDSQQLNLSPVPYKVQLGSKDLGVGSIPSVGKEAAIESIADIKQILEKNTKMLFIVASMGGGTGTGAASVIAKVAHELDILTVGIVTIPFSFEGHKRLMQAEAGIEELKVNVDSLIVIDNNKLRDIHGNMKITDAFKKADSILADVTKGIAEFITVMGNINVDFEDVKTILKDSGIAIMVTAQAEGDNRAIKAVEEAISSSLMFDNKLKDANNVLLYIVSGNEEPTMSEIIEILEYIRVIGQNTEITWGNGIDELLGNKIKVTIIATGFNSKKMGQISSNKIETENNVKDRSKKLQVFAKELSAKDIDSVPAYQRKTVQIEDIGEKEKIQSYKKFKSKKEVIPKKRK